MALQRKNASGHLQRSPPRMAWPMTEPTPSAHLSWTLSSFAIRTPPLPTTHNASTHPSYDSTNSFAFQAPAARGAYGRVQSQPKWRVASYQRRCGWWPMWLTTSLGERLPRPRRWIAIGAVALHTAGRDVDPKWNNSIYHWPRRLILKDWTTTRSFLSWFFSSVPTGLGGFLPIINLSFFFPPKWPCLLLTLHPQWLNQRWVDAQQLDSWWSRPTMARPSTARPRNTRRKRGRHPPMALSKKPRSTSLKTQV